MLYAAMDRRFGGEGGASRLFFSPSPFENHLFQFCDSVVAISCAKPMPDMPANLLQKYYEAAGSHTKKLLGEKTMITM